VGFLLYLASWAVSVAIFSKMSLMKELRMDMALELMPVSGCTCGGGWVSSSPHSLRGLIYLGLYCPSPLCLHVPRHLKAAIMPSSFCSGDWIMASLVSDPPRVELLNFYAG